jgi:nucleoside-diphosphate-sugar epimerase
VLEACRHGGVEHLVYASSSSVYGANRKLPFSVRDSVDHPVSLYAATKKANELMAHTYSHLYALPTTGLRFFTVYGPWGRPDMALFLFTRKILAGEPIEVFNHGRHTRDFTYVDDIVEGVDRGRWTACRPATRASTRSHRTQGRRAAPYRVYNIGNHQPVELAHYIEVLEANARPQGGEDPAAAAARRRAGHLCRRRGAVARHRLLAGDPDRGRRRAFRGLVSGLLRRVAVAATPPPRCRPACGAGH